MAILLGLILGIVSSSTTSSNSGSGSTSDSLHIASTVIFLLVTVLQALQTFVLAAKHRSGMLLLIDYQKVLVVDYFSQSSKKGKNQYFVRGEGSLGVTYGNYILVAISLLLLVREVFATVTVRNRTEQDTEHFWYPLLAVPEILAVILFAAPGLVPRQDEVPEYSLADNTPLSYEPYATAAPYGTTPHGQHGTAHGTTPYATSYAA